MIEDRELRGDLGPDGALSIPYVTVIDLHAGDLPEALEPFVFYDASPVERQARALALGYGLGHLVRQPSDGRTVAGSTSAAAADLGIPSFTAESGERGLLTADAPAPVIAPAAGVPLFITASPAVTADGLLLGLARS
jgi:hypothetical protein